MAVKSHSQDTQGQGPGFIENVTTNLWEGFKEDPFVSLLFEKLGGVEGHNPQGLEELRRRAKGGTVGEVARLVGEYGPSLLLGFGAWGAGEKVGVAGIQNLAKNVALKAAARDALGAATSAAAKAGVKAGVKKGAKRGLLGSQWERVEARRLTDLAGTSEKALIQGTPGLQRVAGSVGGNLALSSFTASQELARGKTPGQALETAAITMALGGGIDLGLTGGARLLFPKTRSVLMREHRERWVAKNKKTGKSPKEHFLGLQQTIKSRIAEISEELKRILKVGDQQLELEFGAQMSPAQRLRKILDPPEMPPKPPSMKKVLARKMEEAADDLAGMSKGEAAAAKAQIKADTRREVIEDAMPIHAERKRVSAMRKEARRVDKMLRDRRASHTEGKKVKELIESEGTLPYVGDGPTYGFNPFGKMWDAIDPSGKFRLAVTTAPEALFGHFGSTGNRVFTHVMRALDRADRTAVIYEGAYSAWSEAARKALGEGSRAWKNGMGRNLDSLHAWEVGGEEGLRQYARELGRSSDDIEVLLDVFNRRNEFEWNLFQVEGRKIGGKGPLDLKKMGLQKYVPHASLDISEADLVKHMTLSVKKGGGGLTEAEAYAMIKSRGTHLDPDPIDFGGIGSGSPSRTGPLDYDRYGYGSTRDKILGSVEEGTGKRIGGGVPLNPNTWDSGYRAAASVRRRIELDPILGSRTFNKKAGQIIGRNIDDYVKAVQAEGYNGAKFRTVLDTVSGKTYYNEAMRKAAVIATSVQVAAKLPMAVLANASQITLTTTWGGVRNSVKAALNLTRKENRKAFQQALAQHDHIIKGIGRSVDDEGLTLTAFEKVADYTLRFSGFQSVERFNRIHAAATAQMVIRDNLVKAAGKRLRGNNLDKARRQVGELGLDLDVLANELGATVARPGGTMAGFFENPKYLRLEEMAVMRGAQKTQFFPGKTRTPSFWSHPIGRVGFQFKTFAVGQGRFFRDAVLTEFSHGNRAPLATLLAFAPIAGEMVGNMKDLVKDTERGQEGVVRYLDNILYVGGLGLFTDILSQAYWGNLESVILGPTFGDLIEVGEAMVGMDAGAIVDLGTKQPAFRTGAFLMGRTMEGFEMLEDYLDIGDDGGPEGTNTMDVFDLRYQRALNKR